MAARPVIVGTDGSQESLLAVEWAAREAVLHGAPLRIVSAAAYPPSATPGWATSGTVTRLARRAADRALAAAAEQAAEAAPGLVIGTGVLAEPPAQALTVAARGALLLVVGSRGVGGFSALVLGSVSRYVATHAPCPVVVAREESLAPHREVVIGVDGGSDPSAVLGFAFEEAALRGARLLAVHAVFSFPLVIRSLGALTRAEREALDQRESWAAVAARLEAMLAGWRHRYPHVQTGVDVTDGHPGHVLAGESARADLVVLGRHSPARRRPGAGTVTHAVLSHAHGAVATVPAG